jgi:hypothetical protein
MNVDQRHLSVTCRPGVLPGLVALLSVMGVCSLLAPSVLALSPTALSTLPSLTAGSTGNPSPASASSFAGLNPAAGTPPDTHGAVSATHVVTHVNGQAIIQDRSGTLLASVSLTGFWAGLGVTDVFDPKVIYDPHSNRFMALACAQRRSSTSGILFGVTATSDPTGVWHLWLRTLPT